MTFECFRFPKTKSKNCGILGSLHDIHVRSTAQWYIVGDRIFTLACRGHAQQAASLWVLFGSYLFEVIHPRSSSVFRRYSTELAVRYSTAFARWQRMTVARRLTMCIGQLHWYTGKTNVKVKFTWSWKDYTRSNYGCDAAQAAAVSAAECADDV